MDAGAMHGVVTGSRFGVHRTAPLREVHVANVYTQRSVVDPIDWTPDEEQQYDMVLTDVPLPPAAVSIQADPDVVLRLTETVQTTGPGGGPSPHIRIVPTTGESAFRLGIRVRQAHSSRTIQVTASTTSHWRPRSPSTTVASNRPSATWTTSPAGCRYATWKAHPRRLRRRSSSSCSRRCRVGSARPATAPPHR
ncbi:hypothetical protein AS594_36315 [Streptomyces agglomeratus]|uniref:Uncharacterized protein n=1 Tax=Streptomyces agglomeratus TaxID=285458 RepID=A0A1E5PHT9_9ACTN|nr:hypothetical protein AS594_36315 [Streptomyces agglomeratus]